VPSLDIKSHLSTDILAIEERRMPQAVEYIRNDAFGTILSMADNMLKAILMSQCTLECCFQNTFGHSNTSNPYG